MQLSSLRRSIGLLVVIALAIGTTVLAAQGERELRGRVVRVADGDTITVLDAAEEQHRVRLNGIDAPELGQPFSQRSRQHLAGLVAGREVLVEWVKTDRYGRLVGTVFVGEANANLSVLTAGLAWYYRYYESDVPPSLRATYDRAERTARSARTGLWQEPSPIAPWDHRNGPPVSANADGRVIGNKNSGIYHVPGCRSYNDVAEHNRVYFETEAQAEAAGFRKARNC